MTMTLMGYARSTDKQDLAAQKGALEKLGSRPTGSTPIMG